MSLVAPQRSAPLSAQVADQLRALIADGSWPLGSRIPPEHRLTEELGVSRNTVREALRALVHTGLLEARPGDGTYVRADSELRVSLGRRVAAGGLTDAFEVRALLERAGARRAAERATVDDIDGLRRLLAARDAAKSAGDLERFAEADFAFHRAVVAAGGNALLTELYEYLTTPITRTISESAALHEDGGVHARHAELLDAISAHDPDAAEACAEALLAHGMAALPTAGAGSENPEDTPR
ncbi:FadR/GntR family transcriptional regulator [Motilibacter aurantiacus]|uniref:FadR/GntR family transcriptional regulator n=1 Tax=Motilibacter aurantiacus TaxID=2714955 RepID=UPI00140921EF|nr:FCD domain-containing protein [Motilibacter aurantiacus]NHC45714.1 FadR family transcriptional regulator [Motilibacter aurantiacus]